MPPVPKPGVVRRKFLARNHKSFINVMGDDVLEIDLSKGKEALLSLQPKSPVILKKLVVRDKQETPVAILRRRLKRLCHLLAWILKYERSRWRLSHLAIANVTPDTRKNWMGLIELCACGPTRLQLVLNGKYTTEAFVDEFSQRRRLRQIVWLRFDWRGIGVSYDQLIRLVSRSHIGLLDHRQKDKYIRPTDEVMFAESLIQWFPDYKGFSKVVRDVGWEKERQLAYRLRCNRDAILKFDEVREYLKKLHQRRDSLLSRLPRDLFCMVLRKLQVNDWLITDPRQRKRRLTVIKPKWAVTMWKTWKKKKQSNRNWYDPQNAQWKRELADQVETMRLREELKNRRKRKREE